MARQLEEKKLWLDPKLQAHFSRNLEMYDSVAEAVAECQTIRQNLLDFYADCSLEMFQSEVSLYFGWKFDPNMFNEEKAQAALEEFKNTATRSEEELSALAEMLVAAKRNWTFEPQIEDDTVADTTTNTVPNTAPINSTLEIDSRPTNVRTFDILIRGLIAQYERKNMAYGDSFTKSVEHYGRIAALTRMSDKWNRLENLMLNNNICSGDESVSDTLLDLATYCVMTVMALNDQEGLQRIDDRLHGNGNTQ